MKLKTLSIGFAAALFLFGPVNAADAGFANQITLEDRGLWAGAPQYPFKRDAIAASSMMDLQPLPDEAFGDPVAFCRGVYFVMQSRGKMTRGAAISIMASNGRATCFEDGRAEITRQ